MILRRDESPSKTLELWKREIQSEIDIALPLADKPTETLIEWQRNLNDYFGGTTYLPKLRLYDNPNDTIMSWQKELMFAFD